MARFLTEDQKQRKLKYNTEYDANNTTRIGIKLNNVIDADILEFLSTTPNKQGLIKQLIRSYMESIGFISEQK